MNNQFKRDEFGEVYMAEEKKGSFIWLVPLLIIPLIMWGVFSLFDNIGEAADKNKTALEDPTSGIIPGIGGGPGEQLNRGVGDTAPN